MHIKSAVSLAICALVLAAGPAQAVDISADEMSSPEWRDCAGHFFFLGAMLRQSQGGEELVERMNGMAFMAVYAGEEKAKAERKAGQTKNGLGQSLIDPNGGQLQVQVKSMIDSHAEKSRDYATNSAYVEAYAAKCGGPTAAFANRFNDTLKKK